MKKNNKGMTRVSYEEILALRTDIEFIFASIQNELKDRFDVYCYKNKIHYVEDIKVLQNDFFETTLALKVNTENRKARKKLQKNKSFSLKMKNLDTIIEKWNRINWYIEENSKYSKINLLRNCSIIIDYDESYLLNKPLSDFLFYFPSISISKKGFYIKNISKYNELVAYMEQLNKSTSSTNEIPYVSLFDKENKVFLKYQNRMLEKYDLSLNDFTDKNISGLDISKNPEVQINFDKLVKDLTDSNINGYNLEKYKFIGWNLTNTDLRNTKATIDLGTCVITEAGKMNQGTLFDEENQFVFHSKSLNLKQVRDLGIKVYKKEMK